MAPATGTKAQCLAPPLATPGGGGGGGSGGDGNGGNGGDGGEWRRHQQQLIKRHIKPKLLKPTGSFSEYF